MKQKIIKNLEVLFILSFMDLKLKYHNSFLGFFWSFIKPLLQFILYYFVFGLILKISMEENYSLILFFGVLTWAWFAESTGSSVNAFLGKRSLISKIKTNKLIPPLTAFLTSTMNYFLNLIVFIIAYILFIEKVPAFSFLNMFIFIKSIMEISILIISINLIMANLNVLYRDIQQIWELVLLYGMFFSPIIYRIPIPKRYETIYYLINLFAFPLQNLKSVIFINQPNCFYNWTVSLGYLASLMVVLMISLLIHKKISIKIVDFL